MRRRKCLLLSFLLPFLLLLSCPDRRPSRAIEGEIDYGDTLVLGTQYPISPLDPLSLSGTSAVLVELVFNGLTEVDALQGVRPDLAESWTASPDGLRWIFSLRRGVRFHDGVELTAGDVVFTLELLRGYGGRSPYADALQLIEAVRARGRYAVEIDLSRPTCDLLYALNLGILPRHRLEELDPARSSFNEHPIGTGPFRVAGWSPQEVVLEAFEEHFRGRPYLDRVVVRPVEGQWAAWIGLLREEIDLFCGFDPQSWRVIRESSLRTHLYLHPFYCLLALNQESGPLGDLRVRRAINYAIDRPAIIRQALKGLGRVAAGPLYPASESADPGLSPYPYAPQRALELLKEAGWEDADGDGLLEREGRQFVFSLSVHQEDEIFQGVALALQQQLLEIGIRVRIRPLSFPALNREILERRYEALLIEFSGRETLHHKFFHSSQVEGGLNFTAYRNPRADALLDKAQAVLDPKERRRLYRQFQRELYADPPGAFLFWRQMLVGVHRRFRGVRMSAGFILGLPYWHVPGEEQKY